MARPVAKVLIGFFFVAALMVAAALVYALRQPSSAMPPLPKPNGYDALTRAGRMLADDTSDYTIMTEQKLQALVRTNAEVLKIALTGLTQECQVPLGYSGIDEAHMRNLSALKRLGQAFAAKGRLAEMEQRPGDAANAYLAAIRTGSAIGQGGVLIDALVSIAVEAIGVAGLEKLVSQMDASQCRAAAAVLESCDARREPMKAVLTRERLWARRAYGLKGQLARLLMFKSIRQSEQRAAGKLQAQEKRLRSLMIELAARACELEKGARPGNLSALVPEYLKSIPLDPLTGTNMAYRP